MVDPKYTNHTPKLSAVDRVKAELDKPPFLFLHPSRSRILVGLGIFASVLILIYLLSG
ncbi:MAG: hypothetical protein CFH10_00964 [Alphaproteobacteria bacterium MarineAlpha4_Bin2]|nr:MAG: hypothetical protein CFH10_00964 [Alphaproteobacteria bacterium MarineAlpha4_Bin2]